MSSVVDDNLHSSPNAAPGEKDCCGSDNGAGMTVQYTVYFHSFSAYQHQQQSILTNAIPDGFSSSLATGQVLFILLD